MLKKLISYLPVSRKKYAEGLNNIAKVIDGLIEADANHSQIELSIIKQLQINKEVKSEPKSTKNGKDPAFQ